MLTPTQLDRLPNTIVELYEQTQQKILIDIARRINKQKNVYKDPLTASAKFQAFQVQELGLIRENVMKEIAKLTPLSDKEVERLFFEAGVKSLNFDKRIYKAAGFEIQSLGESPTMLRILQADIVKVKGELSNLTLTTATTSQQTFINATNQAHLEIMSGAFDQNTAIKKAIKETARDGLMVNYPTGHNNTVEVAVRRAVVTSANQTTMKMSEQNLKETKQDLVQVSYHTGARPSHSVWQGQVYSYSGESKKYPDFVSSTGYGTGAGLGGWNCKHSWFVFFEGISQDIYKETEKSVKYNGKEYSEYEATQMQRYNESTIRKWKRQAKSLESAGFEAEKENQKVKEWQARQRDLLKQTGLRRDYTREQIA